MEKPMKNPCESHRGGTFSVSDEPPEMVYVDIGRKHRIKKIRNFTGFWFLGLCNNYAYVVMLSAAFDILHEDFHGNGNATESINATTGTMRCNPMSTGAVLLADILPSLAIKMVAPFFFLNTHANVFVAVCLTASSFLITSYSVSHWMSFVGIICAALSSGLGEVTFLSFSSRFDKNVVSMWSSGTGGAGVVGALSYTVLASLLSPRETLLVLLVVPIVMAITFWILIDHPPETRLVHCRDGAIFCGIQEPLLQECTIPPNASVENVRSPKQVKSLKQKILLIKPLLKYMIPLSLVYFAEYFINQGLFELVYFPGIWISHKEQYRWYQVVYQIGVFISRSSVNLFQVHKLWILPVLQFCNLIFLLFESYYTFLPSIWLMLAIVLFEGLLGGCAYVNTFYKISKEVKEEDKEFSMGVASLGDASGIALAGAIAMPVHDALCKLPSL